MVSVIIPTHNRAALLARALESVANQVSVRPEVIVCDDGSTDNTGEVVRSFATRLNVHHLLLKHVGRAASARNAGIAVSRGQFIAFLDSDDWWKPSKLIRSLGALRDDVDLVYHPLVRINERSNAARISLRRVPARRFSGLSAADFTRRGNLVPLSSVVVRKELLERIGGFRDCDSIKYEDFDMWLRLIRVGVRSQMIHRPLGYYSVGAGNTTTPQRDIGAESQFDDLYLKPYGLEVPPWLLVNRGMNRYLTGLCRDALPLLRQAAFTTRRHRVMADRVKSVVFLLRAWSVVVEERLLDKNAT